MRTWEKRLSRFLRSKAFVGLLVIASVVMTVHAVGTVGPGLPDVGKSFMFPGLSSLIGSPTVSMWVNQGIIFAIAVMMLYLNRRYNLLRTQSVLFSGLFMFMTAATPQLAARFSCSSVLCLTVLAGILLYYNDYNRPRNTRPVFLATTLISTVGLFHYSAYLFVPVFIAGLAQMRIFSFRSLLAALIGMVTPMWIAWGFGLGDPDFNIRFYFVSPRMLFDSPERLPLTVTALLTLAAGLVMGSIVLLKIYSSNARARSLNGFMSLISISAGVLMIVNYENMLLYMTLLNSTVAFQISHFFRINYKRPGYLAVSLLVAAYAGMYVWAISVA